ncbi:MAG: radical SAM protein [Deltaproteobacteria bacterium]|nr:radical SAM protein [Deltaproteobacteria bacterium]
MIDPRFALKAALGALDVARTMVLRKDDRPFILNHLVTVRCNLACPHCYVSGPEQVEFNKVRFPRKSEMNTEEMCAFYRQLVAAGFKIAIVLGGEPLLRDDLGRLLEVLRDHLYITVFSNGYLLEERVELVQHATNLFVSLDAPDEQHDVLRARPGTFRRALAGIEAVRSRHPKVKVAVNMTVTTANVQRVPEMIAFAKRLGVPVAFQPPTYDGQFTLDDRPHQVSAQNVPGAADVAEAFRAIRAAADGGERIIGSRAFFDLVIENRPAYPCFYPSYVLGPVMPNGDVVGCISGGVIGNVRTTPVPALVKTVAWQANAAAGPSCAKGCRDWGIHDLSAARSRRFRLDDAKRYAAAFVG